MILTIALIPAIVQKTVLHIICGVFVLLAVTLLTIALLTVVAICSRVALLTVTLLAVALLAVTLLIKVPRSRKAGRKTLFGCVALLRIGNRAWFLSRG